MTEKSTGWAPPASTQAMNEVTTMLIGIIVRKAHEPDRAVHEAVRNMRSVEDRIAHVLACSKCQEMLTNISPDTRTLLRTLNASGWFRQRWDEWFGS